MTTDTTTALAEAEELTPEQRAQAERIASLLTVRAAAESTAAKEIGKHAKSLTASRKAAAAAVADAQNALIRMLELVDEHNSNVKAVTTDLLDRGLALSDEARHWHDTGASTKLDVRLNGEWHLPLNPVLVFDRTVNLCRRAGFSWVTHHIMTSTLPAPFLELLPDLPVKPAPPRQSWGHPNLSTSPRATASEQEQAKRDRAPIVTTFKAGLPAHD